jgi:hypothetical protein
MVNHFPRVQTGWVANGRIERPAHTETGRQKPPHHCHPESEQHGTDEKIPPDGGCPPYAYRAFKLGPLFVQGRTDYHPAKPDA